MTRVLCGVDVSSESLAARIGQDGAEASFANSPQGIAALASFCRMHRVELVVMEATGGYEQRAFALLWAEGLPVAIVNPRAVRRFAEGMGLVEKTDAIDAGMIAWFAATRRSRQPRQRSCICALWSHACASSPWCGRRSVTSAAWSPMVRCWP